MKVTVDSRKPAEMAVDLLALPLPRFASSRRLAPRVAAFDRALGGQLSAALRSGDFTGREGQSLLLYPDASARAAARARRVLLIGLGDEAKLEPDTLRRAAGTAVDQAAARRATRVGIGVPRLERLEAPVAAQALAEGGVLGSYRFDAYKGGAPGDDGSDAESPPARLASLALSLERAGDLRQARPAAAAGRILAESQNLARDLANQPGNALPPSELARAAERMAKEVGLSARILDVPELKRRRMGAILAVGQGSANPPRLIVLEHNRPRRGRARAAGRGASRRLPTLCLVGKGITFDSGGLSIKPAQGMDEMKADMGGAAAVLGALRACALLGLPLHVVGVIGAAENMPSGTAYRPGDIVRSMSGKTIEVLNTDAEGRVVLADALHFARTEFDPVALLDVATLTGACKVALGAHASGLFSNDPRLTEHLRRAGETTGEHAWPLPLFDAHRKAVRSEVADLKNTAGRDAGASTAAAFLAAFVGDTPWAHLDIAGPSWVTAAGPYQKKGATGVGVRLLFEALRGWERCGV